jgi:hypothetical protein
MPTIDLPDDELAAVIAAIRGLIEDDKFPHAPRLDPLRAALARLEAAAENSAATPKSSNETKGRTATDAESPHRRRPRATSGGGGRAGR